MHKNTYMKTGCFTGTTTTILYDAKFVKMAGIELELNL
jgi:hypothetical protein